MATISNNYEDVVYVLNNAEPQTYTGTWEHVKQVLIETGQIIEAGGVIQQVVTVGGKIGQVATSAAGKSALCAMEVKETVVLGVETIELVPKAAIVATPKTVAICSIAAALGLDVGFRIGQNLVNLYYGEGWDWNVPGIWDVVGDKVRMFIDKQGRTFFDDDLVNAVKDRFIDIEAYKGGETPDIMADFGTLKVEDYAIVIQKHLQTMTIKYPSDTALNIVYNNELITICNELEPGSILYLFNRYSGYIIPNIEGNSKIIAKNNLTDSGSGIPYINYGKLQFKTSTTYKYFYINALYSGGVLRHSHTITNYTGTQTRDSVDDLYGFNVTGQGSTIEGVTKQPGAKYPSKNEDVNITYNTWNYTTITNKPNTAPTKKIYPITLIKTDPTADPVTRPQATAQTGDNVSPQTNPIIKDATGLTPQIIDNQLPEYKPIAPPEKDTGEVEIPPELPEESSITDSNFITIYNPSKEVLRKFNGWLWSDDFLTNIKKFFEDPSESIVSLHSIDLTPNRGQPAYISVGHLTCDVAGSMSDVVRNQFKQFDFGTVKINNYFENVLDYAPYTTCEIYLPYISFVSLNINDIMNKNLNVTYNVDFSTGSCLAILRADSVVIGTYSGNCATQIPISSSNYSNMLRGIIGISAGVGASIASGGAMLPLAISAVGSAVSGSSYQMSRSGSLGSNIGQLGFQKPFLVLTRPKTYQAANLERYEGRPVNLSVKVSECSGLTKFKEIHVKSKTAIKEEINQIEELLKEGVVI